MSDVGDSDVGDKIRRYQWFVVPTLPLFVTPTLHRHVPPTLWGGDLDDHYEAIREQVQFATRSFLGAPHL